MIRKVRAYKISDEHYLKGMERAQKEGQQLATLVETFVIKYAQYEIVQNKEDLTFAPLIESKTDSGLPGLTAGMKQVEVTPKSVKSGFKVSEEFKEAYSSPKFTIVNGKKVFK